MRKYIIISIFLLFFVYPVSSQDTCGIKNDFFEPNNNVYNSAKINSGQYNNLFLIGNESDFYSIYLDRGDYLNTSIVSNNSSNRSITNYDIQLYSSNILQIGSSPSLYGEKSIGFIAPRSDIYYIEVFSYQENSSISYNMNVNITNQDIGEYLYEDFEDNFLSGWSIRSNVEIIDNKREIGFPSFSPIDGKAVKMGPVASYTVETLLKKEIYIDNPQKFVLYIAVKPTRDVFIPKKYDKNSKISINRQEILNFHPNGKIYGQNIYLGSYRIDSWNSIQIIYEKTGNNTATYKYKINGKKLGKQKITPYPNISSFSLSSGRYKAYFDEVSIIEINKNN